MNCRIMKAFFIFMAMVMFAVFPASAAPETLSDEYATNKSRLSWVARGTDGEMYNIYIIGENEKFMGGRDAPWKATDNDQAFGTKTGYHAYISKLGDMTALLQSLNLFGESPRVDGYYVVNLTDPSWQGGAFLIKGKNGQPDILATAKQMYYSFVDYRFFVIKNGVLRPMKFMSDSQRTRIQIIGDHELPYAVEDGTLAVPWFERGKGVHTSVYMPDFENLLFIHAYTM